MDAQPVIRDITVADLNRVHALNADSVPHVGGATPEHLGWLIEVSAYSRVAVAGDAVAGFMLGMRPGTEYESENYRWFSERYEDFVYVDRVVVAPEVRGTGVGRCFYEDLIARARSWGSPVVLCEVNLVPRNEVSLLFHARLGFNEVGRQHTEGGSKRVSLLALEVATRDGEDHTNLI